MQDPAPQEEMDAQVELVGTLERVVFHNEENGYTVFRLKVQGNRDQVTVVGHMVEPQAGVALSLKGDWTENPRFGRQFQMSSFDQVLPATLEGIRHYLSSGLIKGVGEKMAGRIVETFGTGTFNVLDDEPERMLEVEGVGQKLMERIRDGWAEHRGIRDLIMFLQPHGVSTSYAVRIYRHYGQQALAVVRENPYRLAMDIRGIGFLTADAVAQKLGFARDCDLRAEAGLLYMLMRLTEDGHVYYPRDELVIQTSDKLEISAPMVDQAIDNLQLEERIVLDETDSGQAVYLSRYHRYESGISHYLRRILHSPKSVSGGDEDALVDEIVAGLDITLAEEQEQAVRTAARSKVMVLTGGPGTGKTTIINAIIKVFAAMKARILLAAPTGRAAKRMSETSGRESKTIHRLLEYSPREDGFSRNENNPLACSLLVVDEASMMDTMLMYHLLKAVPLGATVVFVGDVNQLPSVGPGNVLQDVIRSGVVDVVELVEVFRQAQESEIICNAHLINQGEIPSLESSKDRLSDFYFIRQEDPDRVADMVVDLVKNHIPRRFRLDSINDIQVLTPMHKGTAGAANLNTRLQEALNPKTLVIQRGERQFRLDDKVMQIRNNYEKDVFNGDIGRICRLDKEERELTVRFDEERNVVYEFSELDELVPAYAISVHKSQGSEYPAVVMPVLTQHYVLLQRNLLYTGVTRGKRLVVLVGSQRALAIAVKNNKMQKRFTYLAQRLARGV
ncbi:helicase, RecD/TraA family [Oleidesulfovibrio alaskensis G20]|jgi:exodeoxyribonuclease V alpha subunit|uniref:Helicase, RecD/TraA family n=1 Tax=Oleidesulfovibrio alaskensis (strain ATCC BAA-1058 / DSM 17464 / G20) TaxID=207559 RepID=Q30XS5_OLEA2|nr:ATP-dependent RecD-like DNA helicase [Oleidesulfovibrio alaskensis]ABB39521.1 helicase, RecD/TraA family [Oleidesulfovibrio alaskensis G20]MBG0772413.1 ATP-dependent RecD-like DNA helicase [Oleidesulfovibrio alaskensis]MBL3582225.1 ATP-dependent RecD-like DNA helicase [Oleidesulfovibrio alaskensis]